ncbi:MAG: hypothetical protein KGH60_00545 [Candidatus Micrarchaeota archaeon]|nr:hypothetical protein [Candidatus Micrarchaeota archaeon]
MNETKQMSIDKNEIARSMGTYLRVDESGKVQVAGVAESAIDALTREALHNIPCGVGCPCPGGCVDIKQQVKKGPDDISDMK